MGAEHAVVALVTIGLAPLLPEYAVLRPVNRFGPCSTGLAQTPVDEVLCGVCFSAAESDGMNVTYFTQPLFLPGIELQLTPVRAKPIAESHGGDDEEWLTTFGEEIRTQIAVACRASGSPERILRGSRVSRYDDPVAYAIDLETCGLAAVLLGSMDEASDYFTAVASIGVSRWLLDDDAEELRAIQEQTATFINWLANDPSMLVSQMTAWREQHLSEWGLLETVKRVE